MGSSQFSSVTEQLDNTAFNKLMDKTLGKMVEVCGGFQSANYQVTSVGFNAKRLKTVPIDPNKSTWR